MNEPEDSKPADGKKVELRAGDADRRRTATMLHTALGRGQLTIAEFDERTAQTWAAVYISDLAPLTADLVAPPPSAQRSATTYGPATPYGNAIEPDGAMTAYDVQPPASERVTGDGGPSVSVAVWSGFERKGVWTIPPKFTAVAIMGGGVIDLRHANLGARQVTITAVAIMGGIEVVVPDDLNVIERGFGFMGAFSDERKWDGKPIKPGPEAPTVIVQGIGLMGGVTIVRKPAGRTEGFGGFGNHGPIGPGRGFNGPDRNRDA